MTLATITQSGTIKQLQQQEKKLVVVLAINPEAPTILVEFWGKAREYLLTELDSKYPEKDNAPLVVSGTLQYTDQTLIISANNFSVTPGEISQATLCGYLGQDPETKWFDSGKVLTQASLAVSHGKNRSSSWFTCKAWGQRGEVIGNYCKKGHLLAVSGRLNIEIWEKNNKQHSKPVINVNNVFLMPNKNTNTNSNGYAGNLRGGRSSMAIADEGATVTDTYAEPARARSAPVFNQTSPQELDDIPF